MLLQEGRVGRERNCRYSQRKQEDHVLSRIPTYPFLMFVKMTACDSIVAKIRLHKTTANDNDDSLSCHNKYEPTFTTRHLE